LLNADLAFSFLYRLLQPVLDGITSSDGDVEESIARLLLAFEAINAQQDAIEDQDVLDDLLDDIEEGDEVEEARRDLADDLGPGEENSSY
jgi:CRISPR/Cas system CSM-associated protein Csm2 small subunit